MKKAAEAGGWDLYGAACPPSPAKEAVPTNSGSALFVFTQDEAKRDAVWRFLQFVSSDRGCEIITAEIGYLPLRPALVEEGGALYEFAQGKPASGCQHGADDPHAADHGFPPRKTGRH